MPRKKTEPQAAPPQEPGWRQYSEYGVSESLRLAAGLFQASVHYDVVAPRDEQDGKRFIAEVNGLRLKGRFEDLNAGKLAATELLIKQMELALPVLHRIRDKQLTQITTAAIDPQSETAKER